LPISDAIAQAPQPAIRRRRLERGLDMRDTASPHRLRAMDNDSQIHIPDSFIALFVPPGRIKPTATRDTIAARYELCEDLATHLVEPTGAAHHAHGIAEDELLQRCEQGLTSPESGVSAAEATWITWRLAELLGWPAPALPLSDRTP
jgi:hypothetical protein